jgi:iron complex transport system ATP-binding protein
MKLEVTNVSIQARHHKIVDDLSMTLEQGELVGLIGPNGAGKSTLLRSIIGAGNPSTGGFAIDGVPLSELSALQRARRLAYLPQERHVEWQLPARAVVMLGRFPYRHGFGPPAPECEAAVDRALAAVEAASFAQRSVTSLSGGERARILLARALAVEAPLLMADEPIAELDPYHQIHVMEILRDKANEGCGVLAVLHDLTLAARFMDRLILIDQGQVVAEGRPDQVLSDANLQTVYRISTLQECTSSGPLVLPWQRTDREGQ